MKELAIFNYEQREVRTVQVSGEVWFVHADVCAILGLSNPSVAIEALDDDERAKFNLGRQGDTWAINEPGLYSLILRSRKPEAKSFKRWITHEVIPTIRKTGSYAPRQQKASMTLAAREMRAALSIAKMFGLTGNAAILSANGATYKTTGINCQELIGIDGLRTEHDERVFTSTQLGGMAGMGARDVNRALCQQGLQQPILSGPSKRKPQGKILGYLPTEAGRAYSVLIDTGKRNNVSGTMVQQLKWKQSVLDIIAQDAA